MWQIIQTIRPFWAWILLIASGGALMVVWIMQYGFGILPCYLCLWQRWPYYALVIVALAAVMIRRWWKESQKFYALAAGLIAAGGMSIALYHVAIEEHWSLVEYLGEPACSVQPSTSTMSLEELRDYFISRPTVVLCDDVSWSLFGISLAGYNALFSFGLVIYCLMITVSFFVMRRNTHENR